MKREFMLGSVPVVIYGEESARVFLFVHGLHGCIGTLCPKADFSIVSTSISDKVMLMPLLSPP